MDRQLQIAILSVGVFFLIFSYYKRRGKNKPVWGKQWLPLVAEPTSHGAILKSHAYFASLSRNGKMRFIQMVEQFRNRISFVGEGGQIVDDAMEIRISASAVQLAFGLPGFAYEHFKSVHVHPREFYVDALGKELRGGVLPQGLIYLSWKHYEQGYANESDGLNLGLHEMAHALKISAVLSEPGSGFMEEIRQWVESSEDWIRQKLPIMTGFIRSYGFSNSHEFFSVCVEQFFEQPGEFRERLPEVYLQLCSLLRQDPLNVRGDYHFAPPLTGS